MRIRLSDNKFGFHNAINHISKLACKIQYTKGYHHETLLKTENKFIKNITMARKHLLILTLLIYLQATIVSPVGYEAYAQTQDLVRSYFESTHSGPTTQASQNSTIYSGSNFGSNSSNLVSSSSPQFTGGPTFSFPNRPLNESTNTFFATPALPSFIYDPFDESQSRVVRLDKNSTMLESTTSYALNHTKDLSLLSGVHPTSGTEGYDNLISPWFPSIPAVYCKGVFKLIIQGKLSPIPERNPQLAQPSDKEIRIEIISSDKLPLGDLATNRRSISGSVTIASNLTRNSQDDGYDQLIGNNNNLRIDKVFNNCKTLAYAK